MIFEKVFKLFLMKYKNDDTRGFFGTFILMFFLTFSI